jgi:hypothetical protein
VKFQSPSRWGRCCIWHMLRGIPARCGVASSISDSRLCRRFSPLLDGDGVASLIRRMSNGPRRLALVSVPFSMGTVLHPGDDANIGRELQRSTCFSPLLDGDGVASSMPPRAVGVRYVRFQSPSRWGRCCIGPERMLARAAATKALCSFSPLLDGDGVASRRADASNLAAAYGIGSFSPLLDGDGVASFRSSTELPR